MELVQTRAVPISKSTQDLPGRVATLLDRLLYVTCPAFLLLGLPSSLPGGFSQRVQTLAPFKDSVNFCLGCFLPLPGIILSLPSILLTAERTFLLIPELFKLSVFGHAGVSPILRRCGCSRAGLREQLL
jgi:hypothetical protein